jgi:hypothetical protein
VLLLLSEKNNALHKIGIFLHRFVQIKAFPIFKVLLQDQGTADAISNDIWAS